MLSEDFCAQKFVIKNSCIFIQLIRELFGCFLHFISLAATIREYITAIWSVVIRQFECSIVTKISEGIASRETIRFTVVTVVSDFQDRKVLTPILWRHNHRKFTDNYMQAIAESELAFDAP